MDGLGGGANTAMCAAQELFDAFWQWRLADSPEFATFCGFHQFDDKLDDISAGNHQKRQEKCQEFMRKAEQLEKESLSVEDAFSLQLLKDQLQTFIRGFPQHGYTACISLNEGPHVDLETLISWMRFETIEDYRHYIRRLRCVPKLLITTKDLLNQAIEMGRTQHLYSMEGVMEVLKTLDTKAAASCLFTPLKKIPDTIQENDRIALIHESTSVLEELVIPAFKEFSDYMEKVYLKSLRADIGLSTLPDGKQLYRDCLQWHLSLDTSPEDVHALGLSEVKRIKIEMEQVIKKVQFKGSFKEFLQFLRTDPQFYFQSKEELVSAYTDVCENQIRPSLKKLFKKIPETKLIIEEVPPSRPNAPVGYYLAGTPDGVRPGKFYINTNRLDKCPKYEMMTLALHEGEPGHHFQSMYALEMKDVPAFRKYLEDMKYYSAPTRFPLHTAYMEGWGLYCEYLGKELGLYEDPYTMFGHLSFEMHRACRLVADTGIHMFGWTFDQACDLFRENTALTEGFILSEIKRYITWPGQACAYKVGQLKIKQLRQHAAEVLGDKFDVRDFHEEILKCGPVPLDILEGVIEKFIRENQ